MAQHIVQMIAGLLNQRAQADMQVWTLLHDIREERASKSQVEAYIRLFDECKILAEKQQQQYLQSVAMSERAQTLPSKKRKRSSDASRDSNMVTARSGTGGSFEGIPPAGGNVAWNAAEGIIPSYAHVDISAQTQPPRGARHGATATSLLPADVSFANMNVNERTVPRNRPRTDWAASVPDLRPVANPLEHRLPPGGGVYVDPPKARTPQLIPQDGHVDTTTQRWKADPAKLSPRKKAKYYGIRAGRNRGIYYHWTDVEQQVNGIPNTVHQSFKTRDEVEDYMNHRPEDCKYASCASLCKDALIMRLKSETSSNTRKGVAQAAQIFPSHTEETNRSASGNNSAFRPGHMDGFPYESSSPFAMPLTPLSPELTPTNAGAVSYQICNAHICRNVYLKMASEHVTCANPECEVKTYHAECVGLATRVPDPRWRCRDCRLPPPGASSTAKPFITEIAPGQTDPPLSAQQAAVVDLIVKGRRNVCYTGSAGTGKSTVLKAVVRELKQQGKTVDIVAPSGIAALAVGGQTTFSYAGWVPDTFKMSLVNLAKRAHGKRIRRRLCATDVLIIEEISMVDSHVFQRLERVCREARSAEDWDFEIEASKFGVYDEKLPFGGLQVIVTGDFCQLPPVKPFKFCLYCGGDELPGWRGNCGRALTCPKCDRIYQDSDKWAFQNKAWESCKFTCVELTEIHRQSDPVFTAILQKCRQSIPLSEEDKPLLLNHPSNTTDAVHLRPTHAEVLRINEAAFNKLPGNVLTYECYDEFEWRYELHPELESRQHRKIDGRYEGRSDGPLKALEDHRFEECLQLKFGTLVILLVNLNIKAGLVNGAQGKIVGFQPYSAAGGKDPQDQPSSYLPEALGDYSKKRDEQVRKLVQFRKLRAWPIVEFTGGNTQIIYPQCQLSELGSEKPYSVMSRTQVSLIY